MTPPPAERSWRLGEAVRSGRFWLLASVMILSLLTIPAVFVHLPQHARDLQLEGPRSTLIMIIGLFALLGNLVLGRLSDTIGRRGAMLSSLIVGTLVFSGFTVAKSAIGLVVAAAGFGCYYGTFASSYPAVVGDDFGQLHAGTLTGFGFAWESLPITPGSITSPF
jgi:MFS family permease